MRVLVTGGAGFIGSNFVQHMLRTHEDVEIVVLDKLTYAGNLENLQPVEKDKRFRFIRGDIADAQATHEALKGCDLAFNFAAETHVDRSIQDASEVVWTNVRGTQVLLEAVRELGTPRFVQVSTDEVYGSRAHGSFRESDPLSPSNPYSACKAAGDLLVLAYVNTWNVPALVTRSSNNYGPYQHPEKLIPLHVTNALEGRPLPVYGDGSNLRDWLHVEDNCRAIEILAQRGTVGEIYNISGHNERPNLWIVDRIIELTGCDPALRQFVTDRPGHDFRYAIDDGKLTALGFTPRWGLEEGLRQTVEWYRMHRDWWARVKRGEFADYYRSQYEDSRAVGRDKDVG